MVRSMQLPRKIMTIAIAVTVAVPDLRAGKRSAAQQTAWSLKATDCTRDQTLRRLLARLEKSLKIQLCGDRLEEMHNTMEH